MALKALMAVTGLIMIGFLLVHMYGNLKMFLGADAFDHYAEWLKSDVLYPLMPHGWFIWVFRGFMLAAIVAHMWSAAVLTRRAHRAHARVGYQGGTTRKAQTFAARTMRWGGVILAGFLVFHLLQFTTRTVKTGFTDDSRPYDMVVASFSNPVVTLAYAVWIAIVCIHVRHGFWSAFTTLGANTSPNARRILNGLGWFVAVLLYVGFMIMPVAVLVGMVK